MNHISQRNKLEIQQRKYINFMEICPKNSVIKLSKEITSIESRIQQIRDYDLDKLNKSVVFAFETKQSKLNFKTL